MSGTGGSVSSPRTAAAAAVPTIAAPPRVTEIDAPADPRWDAFVERQPQATGHHLAAWAEILRNCYGYSPRYLALEDGAAIAGVLPAVASGPRLSGRRLASLPTAMVAGPLAQTPAQARSLVHAARELARSQDLGWLRVRSRRHDLRGSDVDVAFSVPTQVLTLDRSPEDLLDTYRVTAKNLYRSIRKAARSRLLVTEATSDRELRVWYRLYLDTIRRHRNLPRRLRQLREARSLMGAAWRLVVVKQAGEVIAGGVFHDLGDTVELVYSASDRARLDARPNHALYWYVIQDSFNRGRRRFDFGVSVTASLESFKRQWGTTPEAVFEYRSGMPPAPAAAAAGASDALRRPATPPRRSHRARLESLLHEGLGRSPLPLTRAVGVVAQRLG